MGGVSSVTKGEGTCGKSESLFAWSSLHCGTFGTWGISSPPSWIVSCKERFLHGETPFSQSTVARFRPHTKGAHRSVNFSTGFDSYFSWSCRQLWHLRLTQQRTYLWLIRGKLEVENFFSLMLIVYQGCWAIHCVKFYLPFHSDSSLKWVNFLDKI